jgi:hypothetical protein
MTKKQRKVTEPQFTEAEISAALTEARGIVSLAAQKLRTTPRTIYNYLERYPELRTVLSDAREGLVDFAESKLLEQIKVGNITAIIFFLKTQGKHRGYVERQEMEHSGKLNFELTFKDSDHD